MACVFLISKACCPSQNNPENTTPIISNNWSGQREFFRKFPAIENSPVSAQSVVLAEEPGEVPAASAAAVHGVPARPWNECMKKSEINHLSTHQSRPVQRPG